MYGAIYVKRNRSLNFNSPSNVTIPWPLRLFKWSPTRNTSLCFLFLPLALRTPILSIAVIFSLRVQLSQPVESEASKTGSSTVLKRMWKLWKYGVIRGQTISVRIHFRSTSAKDFFVTNSKADDSPREIRCSSMQSSLSETNLAAGNSQSLRSCTAVHAIVSLVLKIDTHEDHTLSLSPFGSPCSCLRTSVYFFCPPCPTTSPYFINRQRPQTETDWGGNTWTMDRHDRCTYKGLFP